MPVVLALLFYLFGLAGFAASSLMAVEYVRETPIFCAAGGGCDIVRSSHFAQILGIKTPFFGVLFFAGALILALWPARRALVVWAVGGALSALAFISIQAFVLHAFCKFCMIADSSALILLGLAIARRKETQPPRTVSAVLVGALAAGLALAPLTVKPPAPPPDAEVAVKVPDAIVREQQPGMATIVEFVDFECPFCRRLHANMADVLAGYGDKVRLIRKQLPLPSIHPNAMNAALAACCADEVGAGDKMADALFRAPADELTPEGCEKLAQSVGVDLDRYRACMSSERPKQKVAEDGALARSAGLGNSVPVFFVGEKLFKGAQRPEAIRAAIDSELKPR